MSRAHAKEIERLAREGAALTVKIAEAEDLARKRASVWVAAMTLGATQRELADAAGLHHAQIGKAVRRYESHYPLPTRRRNGSS